MTRVVGVVALVLLGVFSVFALALMSAAYLAHAPMLTYYTRYYDAQGASFDFMIIWLLDASHRQRHSLYDGNDFPTELVWSPNGQFFAMRIERDRVSIFIVVLDKYGNEVRRFYSDIRDITNPNWMPDSTHLVFQFSNDFNTDIYVADIYAGADWQTEGQSLLHLEDFSIYRVDLSPDGQRLIIAGGNDGSDLYMVQIGEEQLTFLNEQPFNVSWSPDGQQLLFHIVDSGATNSDLYTLTLADGRMERLTDTPSMEIEPAWSPDGTQIAFASNRDGDYDIYSMNADGSDVRQVTFNDVDDTNPAWVP